MNYEIVKSKAIGGYSIKLGVQRLSMTSLALSRTMYCAMVGEAIIMGKKPDAHSLGQAKLYATMYDELESHIKKMKEETK